MLLHLICFVSEKPDCSSKHSLGFRKWNVMLTLTEKYWPIIEQWKKVYGYCKFDHFELETQLTQTTSNADVVWQLKILSILWHYNGGGSKFLS